MMNKFRQKSLNPHKLYRNTNDRALMGVCSGLADYYGVRTTGVRFIAFGLLFVSLPFFLCLYLVLGLTLQEKPRVIFESDDQEHFWRTMRFSPHGLTKELKYRHFRIEDKLKKIESYVTSADFELKEKFEELENL